VVKTVFDFTILISTEEFDLNDTTLGFVSGKNLLIMYPRSIDPK
jgi:hypothetical protein